MMKKVKCISPKVMDSCLAFSQRREPDILISDGMVQKPSPTHSSLVSIVGLEKKRHGPESKVHAKEQIAPNSDHSACQACFGG